VLLFINLKKKPKHPGEVSRSIYRSNVRTFFSPASPLRGWSVFALMLKIGSNCDQNPLKACKKELWMVT